MSTSKPKVKNKHRPIGIWVLTIYAFIFAGIFPLLLNPFELFILGYAAFYSSRDVPLIFFQAFLNIGVLFTSILTWKGWEVARVFFLLFTSIYFGWLIYSVFLSIIHASFVNGSMPEKIIFWLIGIGNTFFVILNIWYFNKYSIKEFFRK